MADKRAFANLDVGYMQNPKLVAMPFAMPNALLAHMQSILYCAQHLTDGHAPEHLMRSLTNASEDEVDHLVNIGLWHRPGHTCDDCPEPPDMHIYVHDYLEHNRPRASVIRRTEVAKQNANARWNANGTANSNARSTASSNAKKERKKDTNKPASDDANANPSQAPDEAFEDWYAKYPRKRDRGHAIKAFRAALKKVDLETLTAGLDSYIQQIQRDKTETRHIAYPATWLNGERWLDEPTATQSPQEREEEREFDYWGDSPEKYIPLREHPDIEEADHYGKPRPPMSEFVVWPGEPAPNDPTPSTRIRRRPPGDPKP